MSNLTDISRQTGLGVATVSDILRNKPGYREETRSRVWATANQLQYRPNLLARGLKGGTSQTIGIVTSSMETPITMFRIAAIEHLVRQAGYHAFITQQTVPDEDGSFTRLIDAFLSYRIAGLILIRMAPLEDKTVERLMREKIPVLFVDNVPERARIGLAFNRQCGMRMAVETLAAHGHRRATVMCSASDWARPEMKIELWRAALAEKGLALDMGERYLLPAAKNMEQETYRLMRARIAEGGLPTAFLMNNDACAMAAMAAMADAGLRVPEDVSMVGFDGICEGEFVRPGLSTLCLPQEEVGENVMALLLDALKGPSRNIRRTLAYQFLSRQSIGPARAMD